jgi:ubiquinol-cytochrome c reductase cytochrome b subunit
MAMGASIAMLFLLPWLDRSPVKSIRYKGWIFKGALAIFIVSFVGLGYLGTVAATPLATWFSRLFSVLYFAFFLGMPFYSKWDKCKEPPERVKFK